VEIHNEQFKILVRKKLLLNIISEILLIVGGILAIRPESNLTISLIGVVIFFIGFGIEIRALVLRNSKKYKKLQEEEDELTRMEQIVANVGLAMTIAGMIFIIALFIGAIVFLFVFTHSWTKVIFFVLAFELVTDLWDYFKLSQKE
jgi:sterol desaturase/sphingolipid hydroxylase (fatty acid hydroxylase superfamily)